MKAMILAAGYGTRLRPLTDVTPKALIKIHNTPLIEFVLKKLLRAGFTEIAVNVHHHADQVEEYLQGHPLSSSHIRISREPKILDTGGGIKKMLDLSGTDQPVLVHNVDVLSNIDLQDMFSRHVASGALATLAVQDRETKRYLLFDKEAHLCGRESAEKGRELVRQVNGEVKRLAFNGIQIISPAIFSEYPEKRFSSIDVYLAQAARGGKVSAYRMEGWYWRDLGKPQDLQEAERDIVSGKFSIEQ